ncbi:MAG: nucleotidyltransferase domain-containing protein [Ignavibacteria bacterium]|nr:nucleotidyltransferase domain-containing protein [Ignavibacteria bacterium]
MKTIPQIPSDINDRLGYFFTSIEKTLSGNIVNAYLTGSIVTKDFYPRKSDIDLTIIVKEIFNKEQLLKLAALHKQFAQKSGRPFLNGYYLTRENLKRDSHIAPAYFEGKSLKENSQLNLLETILFELKQNSITLIENEKLNFEISIEDVHKNNFENINSYWKNWLHSHEKNLLKSSMLMCIPRLTEWGILGAGRMLCTLNENRIVSKLYAGEYILKILPERFSEIISEAIIIRKNNRTEFKPSLKRKNETIRCVKFLIEEYSKIYAKKYGGAN